MLVYHFLATQFLKPNLNEPFEPSCGNCPRPEVSAIYSEDLFAFLVGLWVVVKAR